MKRRTHAELHTHPHVLPTPRPAHTHWSNRAFRIKHHHGLNTSSVTTTTAAPRQSHPTPHREHFHAYWWAETAHRNTTVRTGPYTAVRDGYADTSSNNDGSPSDLKYALESPTDRAFAFARYQGPSPLPAVLLASRGRTPSSNSAARRRRGVFHCRHKAALSRNRTQRVKPISTSGVSQNPK